MQAETEKGRIKGPFARPPLRGFVVLPLNTVPKSDSTDRRVIVDLSWPRGRSVNTGIEVDSYQGEPVDVQYPSVDEIIALVNFHGRGCHIFKRDMRAAYRKFPVHPDDYHLLGYFWNGLFYHDTVLLMGQRSAAMACQRTTRAVVFIMNAEGATIVVYLDDFIGVAIKSMAAEQFARLAILLHEMRLDENVPKAKDPATQHIVLGDYVRYGGNDNFCYSGAFRGDRYLDIALAEEAFMHEA